ncbi:magnesium transporter CorA family protein [Vagococcus carniphilus]|uniref:Magnesium transporter CorA family protein n=1 Tax=Vagococcus carniphilus TaxID=218144 RepID=A0AAW8U7K0_9ENTE|nr:magnesium transporter CorA family protein [Vagococcus carniphilus]MDT2813573.1 magnesium transporter CorA family protein [Vagococcus carniphilus]MDT2834781.1 magnesium transporter CorA family protein [Vagococcus carniphilus]MDT2849677.1 magnesium transporter CorA family protein [Vagococcus carniphilus]MDT2865688.1 magnesium transporter CorA family protein [Vagococcus carniphilus]
MLLEHKINEKMKWVETSQLTEHEKNVILNDYDIPLEILDYVTDIYEQSNYIHDPVEGLNLVIVHIPTKLDEQNRYISRPVSFLIKQDTLFTFNEGETVIANELLKKKMSLTNEYTPTTFMLEGLNILVDSYIPVLREITKQRHKLDDLLTKRLTNRDLIKLSYLQQTLTFFLSATESNVDVLNLLTKSRFGQQFSEVEKERLEDALIEAEQVAHMTGLEAKIVNKISQIFDSIMNNNLNDTMKFLTVWSLALAIPTLITGFFGMNINLPELDNTYGWLYLIIFSILLIIWLILALKRNRKM